MGFTETFLYMYVIYFDSIFPGGHCLDFIPSFPSPLLKRLHLLSCTFFPPPPLTGSYYAVHTSPKGWVGGVHHHLHTQTVLVHSSRMINSLSRTQTFNYKFFSPSDPCSPCAAKSLETLLKSSVLICFFFPVGRRADININLRRISYVEDTTISTIYHWSHGADTVSE